MRLSNKSTVYDKLADRSGTVAAGAVSQLLMARNSDRFYFFFQNLSLGDLWLNHTSSAQIGVAGNIRVGPCAVFALEGSYVSAEPWYVIGATSGQAFTAKENNPSPGDI